MKSLLKIAVVYFIGVILAFTLVWRAECFDNSYNVSENYQSSQNLYSYDK